MPRNWFAGISWNKQWSYILVYSFIFPVENFLEQIVKLCGHGWPLFSDLIIKICENRLSQFLSLISNFRSCFQKISILFPFCWHLICFFPLHDISSRLHLFSYFSHKTYKIFFIFRKLYISLYISIISKVYLLISFIHSLTIIY